MDRLDRADSEFGWYGRYAPASFSRWRSGPTDGGPSEPRMEESLNGESPMGTRASRLREQRTVVRGSVPDEMTAKTVSCTINATWPRVGIGWRVHLRGCLVLGVRVYA
jgi:hypothetical protein